MVNIFFLSVNPIKAADNHCDQHKCKLITEGVQLLSNAYSSNTQEIEDIYKPAYYNHPISKYTRNSLENFNWVLLYVESLLNNYDKIFGSKDKYLRARKVVSQMRRIKPNLISKEKPDQTSSWYMGVQAYRMYYCIKQFKQNKRPSWSKTSCPEWYYTTEVCPL